MDNIEKSRSLFPVSLPPSTSSTSAERTVSNIDALQTWGGQTTDGTLNRALSGDISSSSGSLKPEACAIGNDAAAQYFFSDWKQQLQQQQQPKTAVEGGAELLWHAGHISPSSSSGAMSSPVVLPPASDFVGGRNTLNYNVNGQRFIMDPNAGGDVQQRQPNIGYPQSAFSLYGSTPEQQQSLHNFLMANGNNNNNNANGGLFVDQLQPFTPQAGSWAPPSKPQQNAFLSDYMMSSSSSAASAVDGMHTAALSHQQQQLVAERNKLWQTGGNVTGSPQHQQQRLITNQDYSSLLQQHQQQQFYQSASRQNNYNITNENVFFDGMGPGGDGFSNQDALVNSNASSKLFQQDSSMYQNRDAASSMQQIRYKQPMSQQQQQQQQQQMYNNGRRSSWSPVPGASPSNSVPPSPYIAGSQQPPQQPVGSCSYYCASNLNSTARRAGLPPSSGSSGSGSVTSVRQQQQQVGMPSFAIGHWNSSEEAKALQQHQQNVQAHHYQTQHYHQQQQYNMMPRTQQQQQQQQTSLMTQSAGELTGVAAPVKAAGKGGEYFDFNGKFGMFVADSSMYGSNGNKHQQQGNDFKQQADGGVNKPLASTGINNFFNQLAVEDHTTNNAANNNQQQSKPKRIIPGLTTAPTASVAASSTSSAKKASRASRQRSAANGGTQSTSESGQQQNLHQAPPPAPVVDMDAVAAGVVQLSNTPFSYAAVARKKTFATNSGGSSTTGSAVGAVIGTGGGAGTPHPQPAPGESVLRSRTTSVDGAVHAISGGRSQSAAPSSPSTAIRGGVAPAAEAGWHEVGSKQLIKAAGIAAKQSSNVGKSKAILIKSKMSAAGKKRSSVSKSSNTSGAVSKTEGGNVNKFANISLSDDEDEEDADEDDDGNASDNSGESPDEVTLNNMKQIDINSLRKARTTLQLTNNDLSSSVGASNAGQLILMDKLNNQLKAADSSGYYNAMAAALAGKKLSNKNTNFQQQMLLAESNKLVCSLSVADGSSSSGSAAEGSDEKPAAGNAGYGFSLPAVLHTILYFAFLFVKIPLVKTFLFIIFMVRAFLDSLWNVWLELYQVTLSGTKHSSKSFKNLQGTLRRNWIKFKRAFANGGRDQRESSYHHHYNHHYHHPGGGSGGNSDARYINALTTGDQVMRRLYYIDSVLGWNPYDILGVSDSDKREVVEEQMTKTVDLVLQDVALRYGVAEAIKLLTWAVKSIVDEAKKKEIDKALKCNSCIMPSIVGDAECFLQRMREKYDTKTECQLPCYRCGKKHMRHKVENRDLLNGRYCKSCGCHHQVKEGDIWCETSFLGLITRYFACVDGFIYEITAFAMCQKSDLPELKPNTHQIYYRIPSPDSYVEDLWLNDLKSCRKPKILGSLAPRAEAMPCGRAARRRKVRAK